ncbi:MAG: hypothetical protein QNJ55_01810 [Xenococcus sp. MO_188.B8]|nr:hypothetical protein [Xenococcus sp. MO_188.B8]
MNITQIRDKKSLIKLIKDGNKVKYLFFWGHQPHQDGSISKCIDQAVTIAIEMQF